MIPLFFTIALLFSNLNGSLDLVINTGKDILWNMFPATSAVTVSTTFAFIENEKDLAKSSKFNQLEPIHPYLQEEGILPIYPISGSVWYYAASVIVSPQATLFTFSTDLIRRTCELLKSYIPEPEKPNNDARKHAFKKLGYSLKKTGEFTTKTILDIVHFGARWPRTFVVRAGIKFLNSHVKEDHESLGYAIPFSLIFVFGIACQMRWMQFLMYQIPGAQKKIESIPNGNLIKMAYYWLVDSLKDQDHK
jgi:hypothetical protein